MKRLALVLFALLALASCADASGTAANFRRGFVPRAARPIFFQRQANYFPAFQLQEQAHYGVNAAAFFAQQYYQAPAFNPAFAPSYAPACAPQVPYAPLAPCAPGAPRFPRY